MREVLLAQIKSLENERDSLKAELEATRAQYDKCLDDVAQQVVQALLLQKVSFPGILFSASFIPFDIKLHNQVSLMFECM